MTTLKNNNTNIDIYYDSRWLGQHGVGRVAKELARSFPEFRHAGGMLKPSSPLDVFYLTARLLVTPGALWFSPGYNAPILCLSRYIFTIHDLNHIDLKANSNFLKRLYYRLVLRPACERSARVLTVSEYSRQRIVDWARVDPGKVVNIGNGVSDNFRPDIEPFSPGYPYLFCVGNRKPHKNEDRLLRAFASAKISHEIRLVFSGEASHELIGLAGSLGVDRRVVFLGRVEEEQLPSIYRGALSLVFPSLYEGFGLPVVEAMACGTPVIASSTPTFHEVAADAAIYFDPHDTADLVKAIEALFDKCTRQDYISRGLKRAAQFSWDKSAAGMYCAYRKVLG